MTTVHELAHVIDWHSRIGLGSGKYGWSNFSAAWHGAPLTGYAACGGLSCVNRWERWAEAVTAWVYYDSGSGSTSYKQNQIETQLGANWPYALQIQMERIGALLQGRY